MVDTLVSGASASRRVGSTPIIRTGARPMEFSVGLFIYMHICYLSENLTLIRYENRISGCGDNG